MTRSSTGGRGAAACRAILTTLAVLCAGIAVFALVRRDTFLSGPKETVFFLGLPVVLGASLLAALRLAVEKQLRLIALLVSSALSLLFVELALFGVTAMREAAAARAMAEVVAEQKRAMKNYDTRTTRQLFIDRWKEGDRIYPRIYQLSSRTVEVNGARVFPTSSLSDRPIVECFADGSYKIYTSDEYGFTNPRGSHRDRAKIVLVGDSFTAGECVSVEEDVGARLRQTFPATVNLGVGGAGPLWELANLVEYGLPLNPEFVFWLYFEGNDFADLMHEVQFPELTQYLDGKTQGLRASKALVDAQVAALQTTEIENLEATAPRPPQAISPAAQVLRSLKLPRVRMALGLHGDSSRAIEQQVDLLRRVIERAKSLVEAQGGRFVFVYVPFFGRFAGGSENFERDRVLEMIGRSEVRSVDLLLRMEKHPDVLSLYPHRQSGHLDADGYAFIADQLRAEVARD